MKTIEIIKAELYRYLPYDYSFLQLIVGLKSQGFKYIFLKRLTDKISTKNPLWLFITLLKRRYMYKYGFQIGGKIGPGFYIGHFGTIVINEKVVIGKNCNIAHNVTIGETKRGKLKGVPFIGDNVWIGTGSVIVGRVKIGNNVLIAPNSYVKSDIPDNSIVYGVPASYRYSKEATFGYINNVIDKII